MQERNILILDDEIGMLEVCYDTLSELDNVSITTESDSKKGTELLKKHTYDLLITDLRMPKLSGIDILKIANKYNPDCTVVLMTAFPTVETALESMKLGAHDYLIKPITPLALISTVKRILEHKQLKDENILLSRYIEMPYLFDDMIGQGIKMKKVFDMINKVANTDVNVLISGESGTGKELVAKSIHKNSSRKKNRFVPVSCGAIPDNLLENEFFGHEKGSFTDAATKTIGLFEFANEGTLFLDEIGELPLIMQVKMLRVLQEKNFRRIGGRQEINIDVRIIAATNRDIEKEVIVKNFREDLYYRLNVVQIYLPPLRERKEDISLLVNYFLKRYSKELDKEINDVSSDIIEVFKSYAWPGNIRQLQNVIKRAMILSKSSIITLDDIPDQIIENAGEITAKKKGLFGLRAIKIKEFEKEYISNLLLKYKGDVKIAVLEALVPCGTFYRLMKKNGIDANKFKSKIVD